MTTTDTLTKEKDTGGTYITAAGRKFPTAKEREARQVMAARLVADNVDFVEASRQLREKFGIGHETAQGLLERARQTAQAARKHAGPALKGDPKERLTIRQGTELAAALREEGKTKFAPGREAIKRAARLGRIATSRQTSGRLWTFERGALMEWLVNGQHTPGPRPADPEAA